MMAFHVPRWMVWTGIGLILVTGLIHFYDTPEYYAYTPYLGVLFVLNSIGALVAATGIYRQERTWGWRLGAVVAGGALLMYVISRTAGLPGLPDDDRSWADMLGTLSLLVEGAFVLLAAAAVRAGRSLTPTRDNPVGMPQRRM